MNIQLTETNAPVAQVTITQAPVAQFQASVISGKAPMTVKFTDNSTGNPISYLWKFGDGATSTEQNPNHIYTKRGIYTVTEVVKNSAGSNIKVKTKLITVR